jgi:hypothetical protein
MMRLAQGMSNEPNTAGVISTEISQARPQDSIGLFPLFFRLTELRQRRITVCVCDSGSV